MRASITLFCAGFGLAIIAVFLYSRSIGIDIGVPTDDGTGVANLSLMHVQELVMLQSLAAALGAVIFFAAAGICSTIERP